MSAAEELVEELKEDTVPEATEADAKEDEDVLDVRANLPQILESLLLATEEPLTVRRLMVLTRLADPDAITQALEQLIVEYSTRGIQLAQVAGGYQLRTNPEFSSLVQRLVAGRPVRLSRAQTETLAIVAYRQPITRPEIDDIRGVDSGGTLRILLDRNLVRVLGKKEEPGRPLLYGTTKEFLLFFNLSELSDLPTLREFSELSSDSAAVVEQAGHALPDAEEIARVVASAEAEGQSDEAVVAEGEALEAADAVLAEASDEAAAAPGDEVEDSDDEVEASGDEVEDSDDEVEASGDEAEDSDDEAAEVSEEEAAQAVAEFEEVLVTTEVAPFEEAEAVAGEEESEIDESSDEEAV